MKTVSIHSATKIRKTDDEIFAALVFSRDGTVSVQTTKSIYFYANAYFHAALALHKLVHGDTSRLSCGVPGNMHSLNPDESPHHLIVNQELLEEATDADEITSSWPGVQAFFIQYTAFTDAHKLGRGE